MTEWDLQEQLFNLWLSQIIIINNVPYELICRELMFPSWQINNKYHKWSEASIDFILYSEVANDFLCLELNKIRGKKDLLSAFCQVSHRAIQFYDQYKKEKMINAYQACLESFTNKLNLLDFPGDNSQLNVNRVIMAVEYPKNAVNNIYHWNLSQYTDLLEVVNGYACQKEFKRFNDLQASQYKKVSDSSVICLKAYPKSKTFTLI